MGGPLRGKQGCWTCRLRRKKCDERRPQCSTCESLSITCYGFGPKPDWMDNGEKEKAVVNELKEIVKHTWRRKAPNPSSRSRQDVAKIAPKSSINTKENSCTASESTPRLDFTPPSDHGSSTSALHDPRVPENLFSIPPDESLLLMHFLDKVFPLQYPMYDPNTMDGGRGWLLSSLLQSKSFYHAALASSTYHRRTTNSEKMSRQQQVTALVQQEKYLEISIRLVNESAQQLCPTSRLGIIASVVQLIFLELFTGNDNAWQAHRRAASGIFQRRYEQNFNEIGVSAESRRILYESLPLEQCESAILEEVASFRFLGSTIIWLDIIYAITAGTAPILLPYHSSLLAPNTEFKLERQMGCQNWVMLQIGRVTKLHERKCQPSAERLECMEAQQIVSEIDRDIQCGLAQAALEGFDLSDTSSTISSGTLSSLSRLVTLIFAYMTSIYLHVVVHGFQNLEAIDITTLNAMNLLRKNCPPHLLPACIAPLFIIGSVAREENEDYFRDAFSQRFLDPATRHRQKILPILEEIWSRRRTSLEFQWKDCLELTRDVLLI